GYGAVGHQEQIAKYTALSIARRSFARISPGLRPRERSGCRRDGESGRAIFVARIQSDSSAKRNSGIEKHLWHCEERRTSLRACGKRRARGECVEHGTLFRFCAPAFCAIAAGIWIKRAFLARRAPPADSN